MADAEDPPAPAENEEPEAEPAGSEAAGSNDGDNESLGIASDLGEGLVLGSDEEEEDDDDESVHFGATDEDEDFEEEAASDPLLAEDPPGALLSEPEPDDDDDDDSDGDAAADAMGLGMETAIFSDSDSDDDGGGGGGGGGMGTTDDEDDEDDDGAGSRKKSKAVNWKQYGFKVAKGGILGLSLGGLEQLLQQMCEKLVAHDESLSGNSGNLGEVLSGLSERVEKAEEEVFTLRLAMNSLSASVPVGGGGGGAAPSAGAAASPTPAAGSGGASPAVPSSPLPESMTRGLSQQLERQLKSELENVNAKLDKTRRDLQRAQAEAASSTQARVTQMQAEFDKVKKKISHMGSRKDLKKVQDLAIKQLSEAKKALVGRVSQVDKRLSEALRAQQEATDEWKTELVRTSGSRHGMLENSMKGVNEELGLLRDWVRDEFEVWQRARDEADERARQREERAEAEADRMRLCVEDLRLAQSMMDERIKEMDSSGLDDIEMLKNKAVALAKEQKEATNLVHETVTDMRNTVTMIQEQHDETTKRLILVDRQFQNVQEQFERNEAENRTNVADICKSLATHENELGAMTARVHEMEREGIGGVRNGLAELRVSHEELGDRVMEAQGVQSKALERNESTLSALTRRSEAVHKSIDELKFISKDHTAKISQLTIRADTAAGIVESTDGRLRAVEHQASFVPGLQRRVGDNEEGIKDLEEKSEQHAKDIMHLNTKALELAESSEELSRHVESSLSQLLQTVNSNYADQEERLDAVEDRERTLVSKVNDMVDQVEVLVRKDKLKGTPSRLIAFVQDQLCQLCVELEDTVGPRSNASIILPAGMSDRIAEHAQKLAELFTSRADFECISRTVDAGAGETTTYSSSEIDDRREQLAEEFCNQVTMLAAAARPNAHRAKQNARGKFRKKLRQAIEMSMSKFEQVVMTGNSRIGRMNLQPSCVACDRPLNDRRRLRDVRAEEQQARQDKSDAAVAHVLSGVAPASRSPKSSPAPSRPATAGTVPGRVGGFPAADPQAGPRPIVVPGGSAYVYRAGFRMPKLPPPASTTSPSPVFHSAVDGGGSAFGGGGGSVDEPPRPRSAAAGVPLPRLSGSQSAGDLRPESS